MTRKGKSFETEARKLLADYFHADKELVIKAINTERIDWLIPLRAHLILAETKESHKKAFYFSYKPDQIKAIYHKKKVLEKQGNRVKLYYFIKFVGTGVYQIKMPDELNPNFLGIKENGTYLFASGKSKGK